MVDKLAIYLWHNRPKPGYYLANDGLIIAEVIGHYYLSKCEIAGDCLCVYMVPQDGSPENLDRLDMMFDFADRRLS
jgi:hypothetical protein